MERFRADAHADTLPEVSLDELAAGGIRGIVVDLDNTVCPYRRPELAPGVAEWVATAQARGFALVMVSNNFTERVSAVGAQLGIAVVPNALKPLPFAFLRALKLLGTPRRDTVVIGDQLFTDVLGAKLVGCRTILTKPLVEKDFPLTRVLRFLERTIAGRTSGPAVAAQAAGETRGKRSAMIDDRSQSESADAFPTSVNGQITDGVQTGKDGSAVAPAKRGAVASSQGEAGGMEGEEDPSEGDPS